MLFLRSPGRDPIPGGVLLLDLTTDRLYVRLRNDLTELDPDVALIWEFLESDLVDKAAEMGGTKVIEWLEEEGSNTISAGDRRELEMRRPEAAVNELFSRYVESFNDRPGYKTGIECERAFKNSDISAACKKIPISKSVGIQALKTLQDPTASLQRLDQVVTKDPALSAHLIRLGNLASVSRGG